MVKLKIGDREYGMYLDLEAMEQIQEEFGNMKDIFDKLKQNDIRTIKKLFKILANAALTYEGKEATVTGNELNVLKVAAVKGISKAFERAIEEGMKSETTGGAEADDEVYDVYLAELEKNA